MPREMGGEYKEVPLTELGADEVESRSPDLEATKPEDDAKPKGKTAGAPFSPRTAQKIKYAALFTLVFQNTTLILMMKQASKTKAADGRNALTTTAVVMVELFKVTACLMEIHEIRDEIFGKPRESMLLLVPSFLYLLQNNLLFVAVANLEAAVYQVTSQLKILTTAFFSVILLSRKLEVYQIAALILLTVGCIVVQLGTANAPSSTVKTTGWGAQTVGLVCALLAQCTSGFAGVFCEKMLKGGGGASMTVRNIQLGAPALVFGLAGVLLTDFQAVTEFGFFQGYTKFTWMVIMLHSFGGLLVTVIMKFADNIAKTFAIAVSLVVSTVMSVFLFDFAITSMFFLGGAMVIYATFAFSGYGTFGIGRASFTRKAVPAGSSNNESK